MKKQTVSEFMKNNPEFKKYKCGYILKSNGKPISLRTIKQGRLHINQMYYILDTTTDEVCLSGTIINNYDGYTSTPEVVIEKTEVTLDVKAAKKEIKKLYEDADSLYKEDGNFKSPDDHQKWAEKYHIFKSKLEEYKTLYKSANQPIPNWLKQ